MQGTHNVIFVAKAVPHLNAFPFVFASPRMREFLHSTCRNQVALGNLGDRLLPERDSSSDLPPPTVPTAPPAPDDSLPLNRNPLHMSDAGQDEHVGNGMVERAGSDTV